MLPKSSTPRSSLPGVRNQPLRRSPQAPRLSGKTFQQRHPSEQLPLCSHRLSQAFSCLCSLIVSVAAESQCSCSLTTAHSAVNSLFFSFFKLPRPSSRATGRALCDSFFKQCLTHADASGSGWQNSGVVCFSCSERLFTPFPFFYFDNQVCSVGRRSLLSV